MAKRVILIGAGNVASHLGPALKKKGYSVVQVYSRTKAAAILLAKKTGAQAVTNLRSLKEADIIIISVKDDALPKVAAQIRTKALVLHTSGPLGLGVLKKCSPHTGVLYPLQTFSKEETVDMKSVPLCIEANSKQAWADLTELALKLSGTAYKVNSAKRETLHLAAVFACNFTNHFYGIAEKLMKQKGMPFYLLNPLIAETMRKASHGDPIKMQTGPAVRGDKKTMSKHLALLKKEPELQRLYRLLSKSIMRNKP